MEVNLYDYKVIEKDGNVLFDSQKESLSRYNNNTSFKVVARSIEEAQEIIFKKDIIQEVMVYPPFAQSYPNRIKNFPLTIEVKLVN